MNRVDLAAARVKQMQQIDDDDILTNLCTAWVLTAQRTSSSVGEALKVYAELLEKFSESIVVLNGQGTCLMILNRFKEAFQCFKKARELALKSKQPIHPDTFINIIACLYYHSGSEEILAKRPAGDSESIISRAISEFQTAYPNHPYLKQYEVNEKQFDKYAAQYSS